MSTTVSNGLRLLFAFSLSFSCLACSDGGEGTEPRELSIVLLDEQVSDVIPTVITVRWAVPGFSETVSSWVEFGTDAEYGMTAVGRWQSYATFETFLVGIGPEREVHYRVVAEDSAGIVVGEDQVTATGAGPADLPEISVPVSGDATSEGGFLATSILMDHTAAPAVILNSEGEYVWWHSIEANDQKPVTRSYLSNDGTSVLYINHFAPFGDTGDEEFNGIVRVRLDGSAVDLIEVPDLHHDFVELPDGTLACVVTDQRQVEGVAGEVMGDSIVEVSADGSESREVWTAWDTWPPELLEPLDELWDWTHANSIDYDDQDDCYHVTLRNPGTIVTLDRSRGLVERAVGGLYSDYDDGAGNTEYFLHPHQFEAEDDGIVVFDNREQETDGSRVVELALHDETGIAEEVWEYRADPWLVSPMLGDVSRLPSGNVLITWSAEGQVYEVDEGGQLLWQLQVAAPLGFGYARWYPSLTH